MSNLNNEPSSTLAKPELLVPAGNFSCLKAGVQNGADCIYLGASSFSARANAENFSKEELKHAIKYCKIRNVKTNLTINTLLTDAEFNEAILLAKDAYEFGVDAIIVQDLGFAKYLINNFPGLEVHASTQMSVHNLEGVLELEKLGFSRVVLSREVPMNEIEYIRKNSKVELEIFVHGALCISYSGQCLYSSLVGGRSGNRGKCAQPCRLPYELIESPNKPEKGHVIDKGYLLSPKDLCSLEYLPTLVKLGINSFKIEGRMKSADYVALVTRIYRKYIDLALSDTPFVIDEIDKKDLMQVFNRGGFSSGHLQDHENRDLIYPQKSNNMGLYIGNISNYNANHGYITLKLNEPVEIGDSISIDGETGTYTISELLNGKTNLKSANVGTVVNLGRMKGRIKIGSKVFKLSSKSLTDSLKPTYSDNAEFKKIPLDAILTVRRNCPISLKLTANCEPFYNNINVEVVSDIIPEESIKSPVDKDRLISQISKLGNTPYRFENIKIDLDDNLHIPSISGLNNLRRTAISKLENAVLEAFNKRRTPIKLAKLQEPVSRSTIPTTSRKISVLLESLNTDFNYSLISGADNIYIPLKYFSDKKYESLISGLNSFNIFIYMPTIIKPNYKNILLNNLSEILSKFNIKGFVISNISEFKFLKSYIKNKSDDYTFVANYTMNIFNTYSISALEGLGINVITPSVEINNNILEYLCNNSSTKVELIAYGRAILMNMSYCPLGKSNKCYPECKTLCRNNNRYYIKDRMGFCFRVIPDNIQTVTSVYNSKITSIETSNLNIDSVRINILDENISEINSIIKTVNNGKRLEGKDYTNGNLNREV